MIDEIKERFWQGIVEGKELRRVLNQKKKGFELKSITEKELEEHRNDGWLVDRGFKNKIRVKKNKPVDLAFEDEVWATFAELGFKLLNKDRHFKIPYSDDFALTQQIDVFVADTETILLVECKATDGEPKRANFKEAIEAIGGKKEGIIKSIRKLFPDSKHKIKFIFATKNYLVSKPDLERLSNFDIIHFEEEIIKYYGHLSKHLGNSARFQLLGNLFAEQKIPEMENQVPAIKGKMGGLTYYSFSIEPEKLLKVGYVLHRNKANKKLMPTYQRLIKKSRLRAIKDFLDSGGFFPNSILININSKQNLKFDQANTQVENSVSKVGILYLPKTYRSAFIIDGQHRIYGYANSKYKDNNSIPVVAFVNLERREQLRLFMEINENQKSVQKNLRNTLNADLLWDSENLNEQIKALKLQIAQDLGEILESPLYDRIIVGENPKTSKRCITIDTIKIGLDRSNFFGVFSKNTVKQFGTFYKGNNDETYDHIMSYLINCFDYFKDSLPEEWAKGESNDGFLTINAGIENLIRIFSDVVDQLIKDQEFQPISDDADKIFKESKYYFDPLINYFKNLTYEEKLEFKKSYGTGGRSRYWRKLQKAVNDARKNFTPHGLIQYWKDEEKRFNDESFKIIRDIEISLKSEFKRLLFDKFGKDWFRKAVPANVQDEASLRANQKRRERDTDEVDVWDCLNIIDYRKVATYGSNWKDIFENLYTKPGEEKISGGKDSKTKWMQELERIRNQNFHEYSVKEDEYEFLKELHEWLIDKKVENSLS